MMHKAGARRSTVSLATALAVALGFGGAAPDAAAQATRTSATGKPIAIAPPPGAPLTFADLIDRVSPAVVSIEVITEVDPAAAARRFNPFGGLPGFEEDEEETTPPEQEERPNPERNEEGRSLGSGFFISSDGYIVTNNHVVEDAREVLVSLKSGDQLEATIVGADPETDLAVLKVKKAGPYPFVALATQAKPRVGEWVVAVGNPFGLGGTATAGIVSATDRELDGGTFNDFIQVDAAINRGNSGGPTFNLQGEVIGVNTLIYSDNGGGGVGIGFAIEANAVKKITDALIKDGKVTRGWLGVEIQNLDKESAEAYGLEGTQGAVINRVRKGGPAEAGGLQREDIILQVNGEDVDDYRDLTRKVGSLLAGSRNSFKILRKGQEQTLFVTVRERGEGLAGAEPVAERQRFERPKAEPSDVSLLGGTVRPVSGDALTRFELPAGAGGLMIVTVQNRGPLAEAFLDPGDVLLTANQTPLRTAKDLQDVIAAARSQGKKNVVMLIGCGNAAQCGDRTWLRAVAIE
jgi:serine protease Do